MVRELTHAQHAKLDEVGKKEPEAKVIGWHGNGPLIRRITGKHSRVLPSGRMTGVRTERVE